MAGRAQTIFWPPGPLPLRNFSSISASSIVRRGGSGLAAERAEALKGFKALREVVVTALRGDRNAMRRNIAGTSSSDWEALLGKHWSHSSDRLRGLSIVFKRRVKIGALCKHRRTESPVLGPKP